MIIESIEMENFKSYGKKVTVRLKDGFTVIIGPNGSGKSNLGDAMLFVLGAKSNKAIRVDRAADFIHKSDPPLKRCSVTLTISEGDKKYTLSREIVNNGNEIKSNYYLNGKRARYLDVLKLIDSFHIYLDSYSFVLQGDINNIIKMSGAERRKLIESMAGIESYKERIENAKNDINGLNENINILDAKISEIKHNLDRLNIDRENARKYSNLKKEIDDMNAYLKLKDLENIEGEINLYKNDVKRLDSELNKLNIRLKELNDNKNKTQENIREIEKKLNDLGGSEVLKLRKEIEETTREIATINAGINTHRENIDSYEMQIKASKDSMEFQKNELQNKLREKKNYESYIKTDENNINKISAELEKFRQENYANSKKLRDLNEKLKSIDDSINSINSEIEEKNALINDIGEKISVKKREISIKEDSYRDLQLKVKDLKWKIEASQDNINEYSKEINLINSRFIDLRNKVSSLSRNKSDNDQKIRELEKQLRGLNYSGGMSPAVKEIHNIMEHGTIPGIYGELKNLIEYDEKYGNAVIVSGGARLRAIVVDDDYAAERCINILKEKKLGRLTFIPLNKIMAPKDHEKSEKLVRDGISIGFIRDFVRYDEKFKMAVMYCFADTLLFDNIENARKHMGGVRIVTLDGEIFEASGSITGGYLKNDEILYNRITKEIASLENENIIIDGELKNANSELGNVSSQLTDLTRKRDVETANLESNKNLLGESEKSLQSYNDSIETLKREIAELTDNLKNIEVDLRELRLKAYKNNREKEEIFKQLKEINPENMEIEKQIESELNRANAEYKSHSDTLITINNDIKHFEQRITELDEKIGNYKKSLEEKSKELQDLKNDLDKKNNALNELRAREYEIDSKSRDLYNKKVELNDALDRILIDIRNTEDGINKKNILITSLNAKIDALIEKSNEIHNEIIDADIPDFKLTVREIREKIAHNENEIISLGPINQKAIQEYDDEYSKYSENIEKYDTLKRERESLIDMQNKIIEEEKKTFLDLFDGINKNFKEIYYRLTGGEATLEITSRDDPLNSEIYIKAMPKGKYMIKIDALSGGEKSVAVLALILAFQNEKPSPVYYLDEVDMFLDGYNAEQVGKLFRENSKKAQVIMVSLKKAVSKFATNIIGVTTDGHGNTKIVEKYMEEDDGEKRDSQGDNKAR